MKGDDYGLPIAFKLASAGLAGCTADLATFPLDTIKVWLQVRGENAGKTSGKQTSTSMANLAGRAQGEVTFAGAPKAHTAGTTSNLATPIRNASSGTKGGIKNFLNFKPHAEATFTEMTLSEMYMLKKASLARTPAPTVVLDSAVSAAIRLKANATQTFNELTISEIYMAQKKALANVNPVKSTKTAFQTIMENVKKSGVRSLYSGLGAGLQRQIGFCSVRIGFYDHVKDFYVNILPGGAADSKMIGQRILAGATTGFMAVLLFQPTEVVKIRMQAEKGRYKGSLQAYKSLYRIGGISEMWKGIGANCARTAVVNVCELVTYDMVKESILKHNLMSDNMPCHFASALISGFVTTVVASPVDVVKTRYMNSERGSYKNPIHCAAQMLKTEGLTAFYKGFVPSYLRLGSWNLVMFISYEQYKRYFRDFANATPVFPAPHLGTTEPLLTPIEATPEPVYPDYVEAMFHSQHQSSGPMS